MDKKNPVYMLAAFVAANIFLFACSGSPVDFLTGGASYKYCAPEDTISSEEDVDSVLDVYLTSIIPSLWNREQQTNCGEVGAYVMRNDATGSFDLRSMQTSAPGVGELVPGDIPSIDGWSCFGYVHSHRPASCLDEGYWRPVGPSEEDLAWARQMGIPIHTLDYVGNYDSESQRFMVDGSMVNGSLMMYTNW